MFEPIIVAYRVFFLFLYEHIGFAISILITSLITSFLMKPVAKFIMKYVKRELAYQTVLQPQVDAINNSAKSGAEKQFELQELYKRYGYSPILATRKVLPLFVQLPFLFLTYYMLEGCTALKGVQFLCFANLGAADALLPFGINLLPFVMTGINILAIFATPTFTKKDQIQALVVASLFLILLYPASSALMIYWTLNNFFTCVKTFLEENASGAKLLWGRVRYILSPKTIYQGVHKLLNLNPEVYAVASFVCALLAGYAYLVYSGLYGDASSSGKLASNCMVTFATLAILFQVRYLRWRSLGIAFVALMIFAQGVIIADKLIIRSALMYGEHWLYLKILFYIQSVVWIGVSLGTNFFSTFRTKISVATLESLISLFFFVGLACHYLFSNAILGLDACAFIILILGLIIPYCGLVAGGTLLFSNRLSFVVIMRTCWLFCLVFYMMPLLATGNGIWAPSKSFGVQVLLLGCMGIVWAFSWLKAVSLMRVLFVLLAIFLIGNGTYKYLKGGESTSKGVSVYADKLPHLANHTITNKYNVFLLFYDGYPNSIILNALDIYDPTQMLKARGFDIYSRSYCSTWSTLPSMANFFDVFSNAQYSYKDTLSGNNESMRFLRSQGYLTTYVLDTYSLANTVMPLEGDIYVPDPQVKAARIEKILLKNIRNGFLSQSADSFNACTREEWINAKRKSLSYKGERPQFLYAHAGPGHAAWNPKYKASWQEEVKLFKGRVKVAKEEMEADLNAVADWDNSILIVVSDHGAVLLSEVDPLSGLGLLDKYGIQLAVKWPKGYQPTLDLTFSGNVMLEVLICLTGDKALAQYKRTGLTTTPGIDIVPKGMIDNGVIQYGPNAGKNLFDVAEEELRKSK